MTILVFTTAGWAKASVGVLDHAVNLQISLLASILVTAAEQTGWQPLTRQTMRAFWSVSFGLGSRRVDWRKQGQAENIADPVHFFSFGNVIAKIIFNFEGSIGR